MDGRVHLFSLVSHRVIFPFLQLPGNVQPLQCVSCLCEFDTANTLVPMHNALAVDDVLITSTMTLSIPMEREREGGSTADCCTKCR